jgi:2-polyprenyl-3-methyl-5-hydroxy-6-metoxy-1,4-benzoquinol methylase
MSTQASKPATDDWDEHWNTYSATNALNPAQVYRQRLVFELLALADAPSPVRLLDLGSGAGELAKEVLRVRPGTDIVGLDLAQSGVEISSRKVPSARFFQQDFTKPMALEERYKGWATHAVCSEVLEHLDDPGAMLRNVRPYMAPGCRLIITVPAGPMSAFDQHIGHRRHFSRELLSKTLEGAGFEVEDLRGAGFPFFNLYRLAVVARGEALIKDASAQDGSSLPLSARATIRLFSLLFKMNTSKIPLGWQLAAVGRVPR